MRKKIRWKSSAWPGLLRVLLRFALVLFLAALLFSQGNVQEEAAGESLRLAEESLRRAVVAYYAIEGQYPPDLESLRERGWLTIDENHYVVYYQAIAGNMMPEMAVRPR